MQITGTAAIEPWRLHVPFRIARGEEQDVRLIAVELTDGTVIARGESCPTPHYGEDADTVLVTVNELLAALRDGGTWDRMHDAVPPGAARNAIDCAIWDLRAKQSGKPIARLLGLDSLQPVVSVMTVGIDTPATMAARAADYARAHSVLKLKLGARDGEDVARVAAVRAAAPGTRLIVDVNEGWSADELAVALPKLKTLGVELVEQPLRAGDDGALAEIDRCIPVAADESVHVTEDLDELVGRYDVVNIKLDKSGGLTEALRLRDTALARGFATMVGCMIGTSLAMAPGLVVAQRCSFVDLDAPLLLGHDRTPRLLYDGEVIHPPDVSLWG